MTFRIFVNGVSVYEVAVLEAAGEIGFARSEISGWPALVVSLAVAAEIISGKKYQMLQYRT